MTPFTLGPLSGWYQSGFPLPHRFFSRHGGFGRPPFASFNTAFRTEDEHAPANRQRLLSQLGLTDSPGSILNPCHGEAVALLDDAHWQGQKQGVLLQTDAAFTRQPGSWLLVSTADCIPLLLSDRGGALAGVVHLGWRNLVANLTGRAVAAAARHFAMDPATLVALLGPAIYPCCYQFANPIQQNDPFWRPFLTEGTAGLVAIDLIAAAKAQLTAAGLNPAHIWESGLCTGCRNDALFSCYKEGHRSGRFATVAWITSPPTPWI